MPEVYDAESSICRAAIHAGVVKAEEGGDVIFVVQPGKDEYPTSLRNGVQSTQKAASTQGFSLKKANQLLVIRCTDTVYQQEEELYHKGVEKAVTCPKNCYSELKGKKINVWGNKIDGYTGDSMICLAAMHAGILTNIRPEELLIVSDEADAPGIEFPCAFGNASCSNNGVTSQLKNQFQRFFKFVQLHSNCKFFFDEHDGLAPLFKQSQYGDDAGWAQVPTPDAGKSALKPKNPVTGSPVGSKLIQKRFECGNCTYRVNLMQLNVAPSDTEFAAIVFRQININDGAVENYQQMTVHDDKIVLWKQYEKAIQEIARKEIRIKTNDWMRFSVTTDADRITVTMQRGVALSTMEIFNETDTSIQRGMVGVAVNGLSEVYFHGVGTMDVIVPKPKFNYNYDKLLDQLNPATVESQCTGKYKIFGDKHVDKCKMVHNYCLEKCQKRISSVENIRQQLCWKECSAKQKYNIKMEKLGAQFASVANEIRLGTKYD